MPHPGRVAFGIGTSSNVIVERWNGIPFDEPYRQVRDMVTFLRDALAGEKVTGTLRTAARSRASGSASCLREQPAILIAALREGMLRLAGSEGDGAIINWLSADDVRTVAPIVRRSGRRRGPTRHGDRGPHLRGPHHRPRHRGRRWAAIAIAAYLNVPVYAAFHEWLGRGELLADMWRLWREGDRKAALDAIPDSLVDELIVSGTPEECREHIERYVDAGVTTPALAILPFGIDQRQAIRDLAPR